MKKTSKRTGASRKRSAKPPRTGRRERPVLGAYEAALVAFADFAARTHLRWYVFGAQAVNLHGFPRATADLDLTVDLGERTIASLVPALREAGFEPRFADLAFLAAAHVVPVIHRASRTPIDLVIAGPGLEQRFLAETITRPIGRRDVPVISVENLVVTKLLAGRPRDLEDVRELLARRTVIDHRAVERTLAEIEAALDESDLVPRYRALRNATRR